jgi:hypothetical protein
LKALWDQIGPEQRNQLLLATQSSMAIHLYAKKRVASWKWFKPEQKTITA